MATLQTKFFLGPHCSPSKLAGNLYGVWTKAFGCARAINRQSLWGFYSQPLRLAVGRWVRSTASFGLVETRATRLGGAHLQAAQTLTCTPAHWARIKTTNL